VRHELATDRARPWSSDHDGYDSLRLLPGRRPPPAGRARSEPKLGLLDGDGDDDDDDDDDDAARGLGATAAVTAARASGSARGTRRRRKPQSGGAAAAASPRMDAAESQRAIDRIEQQRAAASRSAARLGRLRGNVEIFGMELALRREDAANRTIDGRREAQLNSLWLTMTASERRALANRSGGKLTSNGCRPSLQQVSIISRSASRPAGRAADRSAAHRMVTAYTRLRKATAITRPTRARTPRLSLVLAATQDTVASSLYLCARAQSGR